MNSFESLLKQCYDRYDSTAKRVCDASHAGAFPGLQFRGQQDITTDYWVESLVKSDDRDRSVPGTRGGVLWRYVIAIGAWVSLLGRVNALLGEAACRTVQGLCGDAGHYVNPANDEGLIVLESALQCTGFREFVEAWCGEGVAVRAHKEQLKALLKATTAGPVAEAVDFLAHLAIQDFELADVAGLPDAWESLLSLQMVTHSRDASRGLGDRSVRVLRELAELSVVVSRQRRGLHELVLQIFESDGRLRGLLVSRVLPFAESRFLISGEHNGREIALSSFVFAAMESSCALRREQLNRTESDGVRSPDAKPWVVQTSDILSNISVPFLYWCAKSRIPLARLWGRSEESISVWPHVHSSPYAEAYVAVASKVDKKSFARGIQFLVMSLQDHPEAVFVLVTDHWNEEEAAAAYQVVPSGVPSKPIVVLRSDGPRYPIAVFECPTR